MNENGPDTLINCLSINVRYTFTTVLKISSFVPKRYILRRNKCCKYSGTTFQGVYQKSTKSHIKRIAFLKLTSKPLSIFLSKVW